METKRCSNKKCRKEFPATTEFFAPRKNSKSGLCSWCWECKRKANREYMCKRRADPTFDKKKAYEYTKQYCKNHPIKRVLGYTKRNAKNKNLDFDLTEDWLQKKIDKGICEKTGLKFETDSNRSPFNSSIDRIVPNKGYVKENCQLVVWVYNVAKQTWDDKVLYKFCKAFVEKYEKGIEV